MAHAGKNFWGDLIGRLRRERGWPQRALADLAVVPRSAVRRIESGEAVGTIDQVEALLEVLGYELDAISINGGVSGPAVERILGKLEDPETPEAERKALRIRFSMLIDALDCNSSGSD